MRILWCAIVAAASAVPSSAALPPGYEDEMWCPPGSCLRRKEMPRGWTGPRTSFHECYITGAQEVSPDGPRGWGKLIGEAARKELVEKQWTQAVCGGEQDAGGEQQEPAALGPYLWALVAVAALIFVFAPGQQKGYQKLG
eukprot:TRINITY_DN17081_c0_g1_i1.p1 TRINITY_DN17081_c0_g1~~TRINITY_DN17081_c0_g1_i1.p1  ORF type:complete len:140 (+),score=43.04 TRINITY_DN17081_c0_g1_i1:85-504(+)